LAAPTDKPLKPDDKASAQAELVGVRLGSFNDYTRLIFSFSTGLKNYRVLRGGVDEVWLDFGPGGSERQGVLDLGNDLVRGVAVEVASGRITARVKLNMTQFDFRHFVGPDRDLVVLDLRAILPERESSEAKPAKDKGLLLAIPTAQEVGLQNRESLPFEPEPKSDAALLAGAADEVMAGNFEAATRVLERFKNTFPDSSLTAQALYLLADAYYFSAKDNLSGVFQNIVTAYQDAIQGFPEAPQAARASLMRAGAYFKMDYLGEATGYLKLLIKDYPNSPYAVMAQVYLGEIYFKLGKFQLAKASFDQVLALSPRGRFFLDAYFKLGEAYFKDGLYSEATEVFKQILDMDEVYYLHRPDVLYYMGEGYFQLKRPDLSRDFLYHILNIEPQHKAKDVILARIGDTYREEGRDKEAIKVFSLVRRMFPGTTGALISQLRLADYGALRSVFRPESIFIELEEGTLEATLKMYEEIVASQQESPLVQLAMFKMGLAYFSNEDYPQTIKILGELLDKYPRGNLVSDVSFIINKALLAEMKKLYDLRQYFRVLALYSEDKRFLDEATWPRVRHYLAMSHLALDMNEEAVRLFEANKGMTEYEDERLLGLGRALLGMGRYADASKAFAEFRLRFPDYKEAPITLVEQARAEWSQGNLNLALSYLEQAVKDLPALEKDGKIQSFLGQLYLKRGDSEKGIEALEKALAAVQNQKDARQETFLAQSRLGQAYAALGKKAEAVKALDSALKIMPDDPLAESLYLIAQSFKSLDLPDQARKVFELMEKSKEPFWRDVAVEELQAGSKEAGFTRLLKDGR